MRFGASFQGDVEDSALPSLASSSLALKLSGTHTFGLFDQGAARLSLSRSIALDRKHHFSSLDGLAQLHTVDQSVTSRSDFLPRGRRNS